MFDQLNGKILPGKHALIGTRNACLPGKILPFS
jgi:hypothetical protein